MRPGGAVGERARNHQRCLMLRQPLRSISWGLCHLRPYLSRKRRSAVPSVAMQRHTLVSSISLSQLEQDLFDMLKATLVSQSLHDTQMRCAGGWVRDKLLGRDSHDIDIALNDMQGEEFAGHVNNHLTSRSEALGKVSACAAFDFELSARCCRLYLSVNHDSA